LYSLAAGANPLFNDGVRIVDNPLYEPQTGRTVKGDSIRKNMGVSGHDAGAVSNQMQNPWSSGNNQNWDFGGGHATQSRPRMSTVKMVKQAGVTAWSARIKFREVSLAGRILR